MKLYEFAPTRSIRARWTLQELGVEFEAVTVNMLAGEHRSPTFLKLNLLQESCPYSWMAI
jgi:glutathione S-transferase